LKEYDLEHYDDENDDDGRGTSMDMFKNIKSLAYHESNDEDPYITIDGEKEEEDEREELQILATDNLLLAARIEDEVAHLEVYVYEDDEDNLYVHHDIMLPAYPLCVEWLNFAVGKPQDSASNANFAAIGTMDPDIEIWDLDVVDGMYPNTILGQGEVEPDAGGGAAKKKKKKKKPRKANDAYHVDAVLSLAANKQHRNLLASASADTTVKLWDLNSAQCAKSYGMHADKACAAAWNPAEATVLLTGGYDRAVVATDMRAPEADAPRWAVESDVESVRWDPHRSEVFYVSCGAFQETTLRLTFTQVATESGLVHCYDVRTASSASKTAKPIWKLQAHHEAVSTFDVNPVIPGFLATGSTDKDIKLWNVESTGPSMVVSRNLDVGKVFTATFAPDKDVGFRLAVAGSKGTVQIWDTSTNAAVRKIFAERLPAEQDGNITERLVGLEESSGESESESDEAENSDGEAGDAMEG
jgi:periodic tryptophan protein 1